MPSQEIDDFTALTTPASGDLLPIVDVSDTTDSPQGTTKKITVSNLVTGSVVPDDSVTNAKLANMAAHTFKANNTGSTGDPADITATQATAELDAVVGDLGSGGTKGLVPAPGAGDAAAGKFLGAGGTFSVPSGGAPGGSAGGDLSGTYPNPTVRKITTPVVTVLTDAATIATDASLGNSFRVTLGGNRTLGNPTNAGDGQVLTWEIIQDGTGSRTLALDTKFALGTDIVSTTLTTTASKRDFLTAVYNQGTDKFYVRGFVKGY